MDTLKGLFNKYDGIINQAELFKEAKELDNSITMKLVKEFLISQPAVQVNQRKKVHYHTIRARGDGDYQADITFYPNLKGFNNGYESIFCVINVTSRFVYCEPLRNKKASSTFEAFKKIYNKATPKIERLTTDDGTEFKGEFKKFVLSKGIDYHRTEGYDHHRMGKVESFNNTLRKMIDRYLLHNDTKKWVDVLPKIVKRYNNRLHSKLKNTPNDVNNDNVEMAKVRINEFVEGSKALQEDNNLQIGVKVRTKRSDKFKKGISKWSTNVYSIVERKGNTFYLVNSGGHQLKKGFKSYELLIVPDDTSNNDLDDVIKSVKQKRKAVRLTKKVYDTKHETEKINDDGTVVLKKRLQPANAKRVSKKPVKFN